MDLSFIWIYFLLLLHFILFVWQISRKPQAVYSSTPESTLSSSSSSDSGEIEAAVAPFIHKYDVFLSFRGADTRGNFTSHLYAALRGRRILSYIDDVNLRRGQDITDSLLKAIEHSKVAVVVLSENYASSGWCLDELVKIIYCRSHFNQVVLPVFYGVPSSHVQNQTGSYAAAFAKLRMSPSSSPEKLKIWKAALKEIASIPGCDSLPIKEIESLLHMELVSGTRIVGMWGMGGIGKTTLARAIFDQFSSKFEACHFLGNVREELERGTERRLARTRVLVVLDDVEDPVALHNLLDKQPHTLFGPGSRIVVTSRDHQVLQNICDEIYEVKELNDYESLQLFTSNAFKDDPSEEYIAQSWRAISYASGNPLALIVLAKALFGRSTEYWESVLYRLQRVPNRTVQNILRISYDGLDRDEKNAFLDIACFYKGEIRMHALLQDMGRGIIKEESDDPGKRSRLWDQNDVYALLARRAVIELKANSVFRLFLILIAVSDCYLTVNYIVFVSSYFVMMVQGTRRIKGISVELAEIGQMQLDSDAFAGMTRLKVLRFHLPNGGNCNYQALKLPEDGLQFLSNQLMSFHWHQFPSRSLPPSFCAEKLIDLRLPYSNIEHLWNGVQVFL
ncbi:Disease resistance-like protein DSC1 [Linum perenne]